MFNGRWKTRRHASHGGRGLTPMWAIALIVALIIGLVMPATMLAQDEGDAHEPVTIREAQSHSGVHGQVVGGSPVAQGDTNFATFIEVDIGGGFAVHCGGSLIRPNFVLTAAHCVEDESGDLFDASQYILVIGVADLNDFGPENLFEVVDVAQHPGWDPLAFANDVAVLELETAVPSSLATPVAVIGEGNTSLDQAGQAVTVVGWGLTSGNGDPSDQLLKANLAVVSDADCDDTFGDIDDASVICASAEDRSSCQGDSGGPLFATVTTNAGHGKASHAKAKQQHDVKAEKKKHKKNKKHKKHKKHKKKKGGGNPQTTVTQIGVVSFGEINCSVGIPGGYAQLSSSGLHDFIDDVIN